MPQAKTYTQQRETPLRINAPTDSNRLPAISGTATGLKEVSGAVRYATDLHNARAEQMADEQNQMKVLDASNNLAQEIDRHIQDVKENKKGALAGNAYKESNEWFDKVIKEQYEPNLDNDYQRQLFEAQKIRMKTGLLDTVARHQAQEHQAYQNSILESTTARIETSSSSGISYEKHRENRGEMITAIRNTFQGLDTTGKEAEALSRLDTAYITGWMAKNPRTALIELNRDDLKKTIPPQARIVLTNRIENEIDRKDAEYLFNKAADFEDPQQAADFIEKSGASSNAKNKAFSKLSLEIQRKDHFKKVAQEKAYKDCVDEWAKAIDDGDLNAAVDIIEKYDEQIGNLNKLNLLSKTSTMRQKDSPTEYGKTADMIINGQIANPSQVKALRLSKNDEDRALELLKGIKPAWKKLDEDMREYFDDRFSEGVFGFGGPNLNQDELDAKYPVFRAEFHNWLLQNNPTFDEATEKFKKMVDVSVGDTGKEQKQNPFSPSHIKDRFNETFGTIGTEKEFNLTGKKETTEAPEMSAQETYNLIRSDENISKIIEANLQAAGLPANPYYMVQYYNKNKDKIESKLSGQ